MVTITERFLDFSEHLKHLKSLSTIAELIKKHKITGVNVFLIYFPVFNFFPYKIAIYDFKAEYLL